MLNPDETSLIGSEGTKKVTEEARRNKQDKNREENRYPITIFRVRNTVGNSGPLILFAAGKKLEIKSLKALKEKVTHQYPH